MTIATITLEHVCSGGGHMRFGISIDGGAKFITSHGDTNSATLQEPITDEDRVAFLKVLIRLYKQGRTWNQVKADFTNGVVVTL